MGIEEIKRIADSWLSKPFLQRIQKPTDAEIKKIQSSLNIRVNKKGGKEHGLK